MNIPKVLKKLPKPIQAEAVAWGLRKVKEFRKTKKRRSGYNQKIKTKKIETKKNIKMTKRRGYRSSARSGWKEKARKFFAGVGAKKMLGGGILGLGASYYVADFEGVAGNLVGEQVLGLLGNLTGTQTNKNINTDGNIIGG